MSCASIGFNEISTENQAVSKCTHAQSSSSRGDSSCWDHSRGTTTLPTRSLLHQIRFLLSKKHNMSNMQNITKKARLVYKIVYLALRPLFLELGVTNTSSSSYSVSFPGSPLAVVIGPSRWRSHCGGLLVQRSQSARARRVTERPGSAEACAHGFSTEIRSNA